MINYSPLQFNLTEKVSPNGIHAFYDNLSQLTHGIRLHFDELDMLPEANNAISMLNSMWEGFSFGEYMLEEFRSLDLAPALYQGLAEMVHWLEAIETV